MNKQRRAGILMPISALPSDYGIGTLGKHAKNFIDFLHAAGIKVWQTLPLLPTNYGDSPYQSCDSSALNYYFIDFDLLNAQKLLLKEDYATVDWGNNPKRVDYEKLFLHKAKVLKKAFARFNKEDKEWQSFLQSGKYRDFAVFMTLKEKFDYRPWNEWQNYCVYNNERIAEFTLSNELNIQFWVFTQYIFLKQWQELKAYAHEKEIEIMGDLPIYVAYDSVEMWKYGKELFLLDEKNNPAFVAGVPPDAFSEDGQLWGNPVYNWKKMRLDGYSWWHNRIDYALTLFDIVRIDHFRGFDRFFAIPQGATSAKTGEWMQGPSAKLFEERADSNIVAEDLGIIDDGVRQMLKQTGYPGMKVLEFAFDGSPYNEHKPSNYITDCVVYTGTHDNLPLLAFIENMSDDQANSFKAELKDECVKLNVEYNFTTANEQCDTAISLLLASKAFLAIIPMQDVLHLGGDSRINFPSTLSPDNWSFRFSKKHFSKNIAKRLQALINKYNR